jgi:hypothetical protein
MVILLCSVQLLTQCSSVSGNEELKLQFSSSHYNYYYGTSDSIELDTVWMEAHYDWVKHKIELDESPVLNYYKYEHRQHLTDLTGRKTSGFAETGTLNFHSVWHPEGHENVHILVLNEWGHAPALFTEGIAVALAPQPIYGFGNFIANPTWNGQNLDDIAVSILQQRKIPELKILLESNSFHSVSTDITYPIAGSFVGYLIEQFPLESLKEVFHSTSFYDSSEKFNSIFSQVYGVEISVVWNEWQQNLTK